MANPIVTTKINTGSTDSTISGIQKSRVNVRNISEFDKIRRNTSRSKNDCCSRNYQYNKYKK